MAAACLASIKPDYDSRLSSTVREQKTLPALVSLPSGASRLHEACDDSTNEEDYWSSGWTRWKAVYTQEDQALILI